MKASLIALLCFGIAIPALAKDHAADYQVGIFSATGQLSDGSYSQCSGRTCSGWSAAHNIHYVRTNDGMYAIQAPISVGKSVVVGMFTDGLGPMVHKEWFMDQLHEGDQVLFDPRCNKHNNCTFYLPDPDKTGKEYATLGFYRADVAKTNTTTLCGKGKLSPAVEAQVCQSAKLPHAEARPAYTPASPASTPPSVAQANNTTETVAPAPTAAADSGRPVVPSTPASNPNQRGPVTNDKW